MNSLQLITETWPRDIWGLIDYEADDLIQLDLNLEKNGFIYRHFNRIIFSENEINEENYEKLFQILKNENSEYVLNFNKVEYDETDNISSINHAWFLLRPQKMENKISKYRINEGDIIKIGRITIRIIEIKNEKDNIDYYLNQKKGGTNLSNNSVNIINSNNNSRIINEIIEITKNYKNKNLGSLRTGVHQPTAIETNPSYKKINKEDKVNLDNKNDINIINEDRENKSEDNENNNNESNDEINNKRKLSKNKICRICYIEEDEPEENPLLNPCICAGSMKYIHYQCLRRWIINKCYSKIESNNNSCSIYKIKPVECELCKTKFPDIIIKNGKKYNVSEFKPDYENYFIFESLTLDKNRNKYIYIVALNENEDKIYLGRDRECNVLFSDISVSRTHCIFSIENNNIYLNDNDSTFGTLVLMKAESIKLIENLPLYIQIGRTFFKILPKIQKLNFLCCGASERPNDKFYFKQNEKHIFYHKKIIILNLDDNENTNINDSNINIKKIKIKKNKDNKDNENNSVIENKDNIYNYISNFNENTEKVNAIKDFSVNSRSLRKIKLNDDLIDKDKKENMSIQINKINKNLINIDKNEFKKADLIDNNNDNNINENSKNNNSQSIYLDEDN